MYMPKPLGAISLSGGKAAASFDVGTVGTAILFIYPGIFSFVGVEFILFLCARILQKHFPYVKTLRSG